MGSKTHICTLTKRDNVLFYDSGFKDRETINGSKDALLAKNIDKALCLLTAKFIVSISIPEKF